MFGIIFYIGVCIVVSGAITFVWTVTRPIQNRDEMRSWRTWCWVFVFSLALPYGVFEAMTRSVGPDMKPAVEQALHDSEIEGDMDYYKVVWYTGRKAKIIAICKEKTVWGGTDKPAVRIQLVKDAKGKWKPDTYDIIACDRLNKDGIVFPPFY